MIDNPKYSSYNELVRPVDHYTTWSSMEINFEPVERVTISEEIIKKILGLINTGRLKPGSKLPSERELMEQFRVSRTSVREALQSLTMVGVLETFPGDGTYVTRQLSDLIVDHLEWPALLDRRDVIELMEVREPLEVAAAGLAAQHVTPAQIEELRAIAATRKTPVTLLN
jgi:GntR family transcriptional regulator, transcriptional repressor for pyruvate dehydrogenase complex